jgi:hypothetical protein
MPPLIINIYVSLMYELKKNGKVFTSKFVGTGPSSYEKRIYRGAVSQRLRNSDLANVESGPLFPRSGLTYRLLFKGPHWSPVY